MCVCMCVCAVRVCVSVGGCPSRRGECPAHTHLRRSPGLHAAQYTPTSIALSRQDRAFPRRCATHTRPPHVQEKASQRIFFSFQLHPRPQHPPSSMAELLHYKRTSQDRATSSVEQPCDEAAPPAAQASMSALARRASACANRSTRLVRPPPQHPTCRGVRTSTLYACGTRAVR